MRRKQKRAGGKAADVCRFEEKKDKATLRTVSPKIRTAADALAYAKVDKKVWEIDRQLVNSWEMPDGTGGKMTCWQVKIWLKRRAPRDIAKAVAQLFRSLADRPPTYARPPRPRISSSLMLEVSLFDAHFGKLCWAAETGTNYDLRIAARVYENAVVDLIHATRRERISRILFPIGQDFFHVNNWVGTTAKGTRQDIDSRPIKVFKAGCAAIVRAIDRCQQVAPVDVEWIRGNHDPETSFYLACWIEAYYRQAKHVRVDTSAKSRKFVTHGVNLICFTHGDKEPHRDLPTICMSEEPRKWARAKIREIHLGHLHKAKETTFVTADEYNGTRVRILPSLSGYDAWHYESGYIGARRAAEAYLWDAREGYVGHRSVNVREAA